ncbi:radical SAM/SPASM domain-containing protein [Thermodesulfobacteriota bacterium]
MIQPVPNANFISLGGISVNESADPKYLEYRRQWIENPKYFILRDFPIHLDIEITNRCNLKCTFCDKLPYISRDQTGDMDFELYKRIIDEGKEYELCSVKLSYRGESLLHPKVAEMVQYAKKKGIIDIYFNTNGMLLTEKMVLRLIDAGLDRISVSVEGTDPVAFERARCGAKFDRILKNVDRLLELRSQNGTKHPKVRIQTVALPSIDLAEYAEYWLPHCDEVAAIDYKEADVVKRNKCLEDSDWACPQLWQRMTIEWDGAVIPCNNDDYRLLSPGNANGKSIHDCWHDPAVQIARELHKKGKSHLVEACNGCPWRTTQILRKQKVSSA